MSQIRTGDEEEQPFRKARRMSRDPSPASSRHSTPDDAASVGSVGDEFLRGTSGQDPEYALNRGPRVRAGSRRVFEEEDGSEDIERVRGQFEDMSARRGRPRARVRGKGGRVAVSPIVATAGAEALMPKIEEGFLRPDNVGLTRKRRSHKRPVAKKGSLEVGAGSVHARSVGTDASSIASRHTQSTVNSWRADAAGGELTRIPTAPASSAAATAAAIAAGSNGALDAAATAQLQSLLERAMAGTLAQELESGDVGAVLGTTYDPEAETDDEVDADAMAEAMATGRWAPMDAPQATGSGGSGGRSGGVGRGASRTLRFACGIDAPPPGAVGVASDQESDSTAGQSVDAAPGAVVDSAAKKTMSSFEARMARANPAAAAALERQSREAKIAPLPADPVDARATASEAAAASAAASGAPVRGAPGGEWEGEAPATGGALAGLNDDDFADLGMDDLDALLGSDASMEGGFFQAGSGEGGTGDAGSGDGAYFDVFK